MSLMCISTAATTAIATITASVTCLNVLTLSGGEQPPLLTNVQPCFVPQERPNLLNSLDPSGPLAHLYSLFFLAPGWDGEDAPRPSSDALRVAHDVIESFRNLGHFPLDVSADVLGGVAVWFENRELTRRVWLACMNDGEVRCLFDDAKSGQVAAVAFNWEVEARINAFLKGTLDP